MKFYYIQDAHIPNMVKLLNKFDIETYDIKEYDNTVGFLILSTDLFINTENVNLFKKYSLYQNLFFIINDANEGFPFKDRVLYHIKKYLDSASISRNRIIYSYNNSINLGITHYSDIELNTIYFPTFFLENSIGPDWDVVNNIKKSTIKTHDFSLFVKNGKPHKKMAILNVIENKYNCLMTYAFNRDFESNQIQTLQTCEFDSHLHTSNYFKSKIDILIESEYNSYISYNPNGDYNPMDNNFDKMLHLSEKIWRVVAWGIPFVVVGQKHMLKHLREIGFKTFDTLVDESYDNMDDDIRVYESIKQSKELLKFYDTPELNSILEYNKNLYLDNTFKKQKLHEFFINPLKNYIEDLVWYNVQIFISLFIFILILVMIRSKTSIIQIINIYM